MALVMVLGMVLALVRQKADAREEVIMELQVS
jgi:hypothetical protein